LNAGEL
jgi:hypothetical protein